MWFRITIRMAADGKTREGLVPVSLQAADNVLDVSVALGLMGSIGLLDELRQAATLAGVA
jgi:hypothetical protein